MDWALLFKIWISFGSNFLIYKPALHLPCPDWSCHSCPLGQFCVRTCPASLPHTCPVLPCPVRQFCLIAPVITLEINMKLSHWTYQITRANHTTGVKGSSFFLQEIEIQISKDHRKNWIASIR